MEETDKFNTLVPSHLSKTVVESLAFLAENLFCTSIIEPWYAQPHNKGRCLQELLLPGKHVELTLTCSLSTKEIHVREEFEPHSTNVESYHHSECIIHSVYYSVLLNKGQSKRI